jgi:hypothetical protein
MTPDTEKSGFGVESGPGKIGASHRLNWSEERATASGIFSTEKNGHMSGGKATHYVYDIFQPHDSLALSGNCGTLCTTLCTKL